MDALLRHNFWIDVENFPLSWTIGGTWLFPFIESIHVLAITMVLGSLVMVDLRMLGWAAKRYSVATLHQELVPLTWVAFVIAVITGLGMFITRAASHVVNPAFQWKMFLLLVAGLNLWFFHRLVFKTVQAWGSDPQPPHSVRFFAAMSLVTWTGVMLSGRWIGHII